jgi:VWFA-related protein
VRNTLHGHLLPLLLFVGLTLPVVPQSKQQTATDEPIKLSAELVTLDAQILSKRTGAVVGGLVRENFSLSEDGVKQKITHFSQDKLPLSILLLLDVSGSVSPIINRVRDEGLRALRQLKPGDEVALMVFGMWAQVFQDFTRDRQLIAKRVADIGGIGPWISEGTYIDEALYQAAKHLARASNPNSRRIVIIITDNLSNQQVGLAHSEQDALGALLETGATVSGLVVGDFAKVVSDYQKQGFLIRDSIGNFVKETGGIVLPVDQDDAVTKLAALIERLRTRYSFGYTSRNEKRDGRFRKIKLTISPEVEHREGNVVIITKSGYYSRGPG